MRFSHRIATLGVSAQRDNIVPVAQIPSDLSANVLPNDLSPVPDD
jgi:hypothetical protein